MSALDLLVQKIIRLWLLLRLSPFWRSGGAAPRKDKVLRPLPDRATLKEQRTDAAIAKVEEARSYAKLIWKGKKADPHGLFQDGDETLPEFVEAAIRELEIELDSFP